MIETNLMRGWAGIVEAVTLVAFTILALGLIVSAVKLSDAVRYVGTIVVVLILLLMLPAIMMSAWSAMPLWQQFGIVAMVIGVCLWWQLRRKTSDKQ